MIFNYPESEVASWAYDTSSALIAGGFVGTAGMIMINRESPISSRFCSTCGASFSLGHKSLCVPFGRDVELSQANLLLNNAYLFFIFPIVFLASLNTLNAVTLLALAFLAYCIYAAYSFCVFLEVLNCFWNLACTACFNGKRGYFSAYSYSAAKAMWRVKRLFLTAYRTPVVSFGVTQRRNHNMEIVTQNFVQDTSG